MIIHYVLIIVGAATIATLLMRLVEKLDRPSRK